MAVRPIELEEARSRVLERAAPLGQETVALAVALDRVLAQSLTAPLDVPGFDNSAMDGYALRAADSAPGARPRVVGESRAGAPAGLVLAAGEACAISTGAAIPAGADAVIRVEDTRLLDDTVELAAAVPAGANVRRAGEDVRAGTTVLGAGVRIGPAELGVLAALGLAQVPVGSRARVAVLTTGDELAPVGEPLGPGGVHDSSAIVMPALVQRAGGQLHSLAHAADTRSALEDALELALRADLVVICGGVSVGAHDHVARALESLAVEPHFAGVALRPGRPTMFGTRGDTLVFGLPGNPVSSFVTFLLFVRPALLALAGARPDARRARAALAERMPREAARVHAVRCGLELRDDGWWATATGPQGSHVLSSMLGAEAFALIPAGPGAVEAGDQVTIELI